jgi:polysaccharide biosynthesis/export protein
MYMLRSKWFLFFLVIATGTSCVSRKQLIYLQEKKGREMEMTEEGYVRVVRSLYKLQQGDMLMVTVKSLDEDANELFRDADLSGTSQGGGGMIGAAGGAEMFFFLRGYTVDSEGNIDLPIIGKLPVAGLNEEEVQQLIDKHLSLYFKESTVFSKVRQAGIRYSVLGEVNNPGRHVLFQPYVNILEALANAGDIAFIGDRREVQIIRLYPEGLRIFEVNLTDRSILNDPLFFIQPNDIIQVKPLPQKSIGLGTTGLQTFTATMTLITSTLLIISLFN